MCKLVTFVADRKTMTTKSIDVQDTSRELNYKYLVEAYADKYIEMNKSREGKHEHNS